MASISALVGDNSDTSVPSSAEVSREDVNTMTSPKVEETSDGDRGAKRVSVLETVESKGHVNTPTSSTFVETSDGEHRRVSVLNTDSSKGDVNTPTSPRVEKTAVREHGPDPVSVLGTEAASKGDVNTLTSPKVEETGDGNHAAKRVSVFDTKAANKGYMKSLTSSKVEESSDGNHVSEWVSVLETEERNDNTLASPLTEESTEEPKLDESSDRDGHSRGKDGTSNNTMTSPLTLVSIEEPKLDESSDRNGYSRGGDEHNNNTTTSPLIVETPEEPKLDESSDRDGHSRGRDGQSNNTMTPSLTQETSEEPKLNESSDREGETSESNGIIDEEVKSRGRLINEFNTEFFNKCHASIIDTGDDNVHQRINYSVNIDLDVNVSSDVTKLFLIFDFRSSNDSDDIFLNCYINLRLKQPNASILYRVLWWEHSPTDTVTMYIHSSDWDGQYLNQGLQQGNTHVSRGMLHMKFEWLFHTRVFRMELQLGVVDDLRLNLAFTSSAKGVVRPPFWDGLTAYAFHFSYPHLQLDAEPADAIFFSWEHLGVDMTTKRYFGESVEISIDDGFQKLHFCGQTTPLPRLFQCRSIRVAYITIPDLNQLIANTGFSLRVSFHNDSALPQQLTDETWNCSVPHWADFQEHLLCNLLTECVGGEDETACPYSDSPNGTCPPGYWSAGGSCFSFDSAVRYETSWNEAAKVCAARGARLPNLHTEEKWRAVVDLLQFRRWQYVYIGLTAGHSTFPEMRWQYVYIGLTAGHSTFPGIYYTALQPQWTDGTVAYYVKVKTVSKCKPCALFRIDLAPGILFLDKCQKKVSGNIMCEKPPTLSGPSDSIHIEDVAQSYENITRCPKGHVTHNFLSCDPLSDCLSGCYESLSRHLTSVPPAFQCHNKVERVAFTLVCDHRADCSDASDEMCEFPECPEFQCDNQQCIPKSYLCDHLSDCLDGSDESLPDCLQFKKDFNDTTPLPARVVHNSYGYSLMKINETESADNGSACPSTHFACPGISYYCLPVYLRCNGVFDCPGHQDETDCQNFQCPGLFRCRGSKICLDSSYVCDFLYQCPLRDDELLCYTVCPFGCTCYGLAFFCTARCNASRHAGLTFLDARGSGMSLRSLVKNTMLCYLNLAQCSITHLETMRFVNVYHLDLSGNSITTLVENHVSSCKKLQTLVLAGNPLRSVLEDSSPSSKTFLPLLELLDLSSVPINSIDLETFRIFRTVSNLNLSNTGIDAVSAFSFFVKLRVLDLRGCPVTYFTRSIFQGLDDLNTVYTDNYKLCCPDTLPDGFNVLNCHAPFDEVSSCEDLLKSGLYRVSLSVLASLTIVGNAGSFVYRVIINRSKKQTSFGLFVINLCVSDFLMGLYSATIGVADRVYLGNYLWNDVTWRRSGTCKTAGFLSLVSNEVSVLIICLITVDRFLVIRFPFSRHLHFSPRSARVACITVWGAGILLAATPLLPVTSHWRFYSQTGMCIPLPVTRNVFDGREYSIGVFVFLNFVLFLVIAIGQLFIYLSVSANSMATSDTTQKAKDLTIARRLITVAVSDFLCWFPVGFLGILSSRGHPIPGEASAVIAVFVLPLNSALNPFLYTVNIILEQRQRAREQRLLKMLLARHAGSTVKGGGVQSTSNLIPGEK